MLAWSVYSSVESMRMIGGRPDFENRLETSTR
jgi:hypothetical protein